MDLEKVRCCHLHVIMYVGAPARSNHFSITASFGHKHTVKQYFNRVSVRGVVSIRSMGKVGSSRATTKASSRDIIVGVKLVSPFPSPVRLPRMPAGPWVLSTDAAFLLMSPLALRRLLLLVLALLSSVPVLVVWVEGFNLNFEIRSFCVVDFLDCEGGLFSCESFCRLA